LTLKSKDLILKEEVGQALAGKGKNSFPDPGKELSFRLTGFPGGTAMKSPGILQKRELRLICAVKIRQVAHVPGIRPRCSSAAEFALGAEHLIVDDIENVRTGPGHN
jgi:hypothetical protein